MLSLNPSYYGSVFVTPKTIVEKYIKMASFCALKSLLWILNNQGGNFSVEEIAKAIGVDSLAYLSVDATYKLAQNASVGFCNGCFTGNYPIAVPKVKFKDKFEQKMNRMSVLD